MGNIILGVPTQVSTPSNPYQNSFIVYSKYPNVYVKNFSVNITGLQDSMTPVFVALAALGASNFVFFIITSGNDSSHRSGSYHYLGRAVDVSFKNATTGKDIAGFTTAQGATIVALKAMLNPYASTGKTDFDVVVEKDHVHIEYNPHETDLHEAGTKPSGSISDSQKEKQPEEPWIRYCHSDPTIDKVSDLLSKVLLFKDYKDKEQEFLNLKGPGNQTNKQCIEGAYYNPDPDNKTEEYPLLKVGTVLYVKPSQITKSLLALEGSGQIKKFSSWGEYQTTTQIFLNKLDGYIPVYSYKSSKGFDLAKDTKDPSTTLVKYVNPSFRVWIYSKVHNEVLNVTPYCFSVNTNCSMDNSDSFSLGLISMRPWGKDFVESSKKGTYSNIELVTETDAFYPGSISHFMLNISENDIVFISFEQLECEDQYQSNDVVDKSILANQYYDFIGLVSSVSSSIDASGAGTINITGQSVSKLFQDDEAIFRPIAAMSDSFAGTLIIGERQKKRGFMQRMFVDGTFQSLFTSTFRTIERTLKFFLNTVSNVGLVPIDASGSENFELFSSWGKDRTKLFKVTADGDGKVSETLSDEFAQGLYQIIKLSVDPELNKRHLADAAVSNPEGTIMTLLQSVCAPHLTELILDTYKNTFDIIVRTPPFSKKAITEWLDTIQALDGEGKNSFGNIAVEDVQQENLSWETNFYTWYELQPQGNIIPADGLVSLCWIPTLFLSEFIEVWGSRRLSVISPYTVIGSDIADTKSEIQQSIQDLVWLVQSNFYLPFTRRGTITLKVPDRRIKKGQWIRYKRTGEIFYVEGVQQSVAVSAAGFQRTTVLQVSRGLIEKYVKDDKNGYFNIIDFDALEKSLEAYSKDNKNSTSTTPIINKKLFNFFLHRRQI